MIYFFLFNRDILQIFSTFVNVFHKKNMCFFVYYHDMETMLPLCTLPCLRTPCTHARKNTRNLTRYAKRNHNKKSGTSVYFLFVLW